LDIGCAPRGRRGGGAVRLAIAAGFGGALARGSGAPVFAGYSHRSWIAHSGHFGDRATQT
jgi:hypothetical protein